MTKNVYRTNRADFYEKILEFDFSEEELNTFLLDWEGIIRSHSDDTYSPYLELHDLIFLFTVTKGDGKAAVEYLNTLVYAGEVISDESWEKFKNRQYYKD